MAKQKLPKIVIGADDHDSLTNLATEALDRIPDVAGELLSELDRARVVAPRQVPPTVVRMGSTVVFRADEAPERRVTLVYPAKADIAEGRVSVMTPIGAALIGLSESQSIQWTARDGRKHQLTIVSVEQPAANAA